MTKSKAAKIAKKLKKVAVKKHPVKKLEKEVGKMVVTGHGDYVPSRFNRVKGHGGYFSDLASNLASGVNGVASLVGGVLDTGHSLIKSITGMGDYRERVKKHAILMKGKNPSDAIANWQSMNMGAMNVQFGGGTAPRVVHREFIGAVKGSTQFKTRLYRIQPGLRGLNVLFPWGSSVANCFEQYQLNGMILEYKSTSSNYSSTSNLGVVMLSTVYDAEAPPLANQLAIDNHEFTTSDMPCNSFIHPIELAPNQSSISTHYVQSSNASGGTDDSRFNDIGVFQVSTIGNQSDDVIIGELWASYDITFLKPLLPDLHAGTSALINCNESGYFHSGGFLDSPNVVYDAENSLPVKILTGNQIQLPVGYAGKFQLSLVCTNTAENTYGKTLPTINTWGSDITPVYQYPSSAGSTQGSTNLVFMSGDSNDATVMNDYTNSASVPGACNLFTFETIAETESNNFIVFNLPVGFTRNDWTFMILINALDSDLPSGRTTTVPPDTVKFRHVTRFKEIEEKSIKLERSQRELDAKLKRLESLMSRANSPIHVEQDEEKELEKSIHMTQDQLKKLLSPVFPSAIPKL